MANKQKQTEISSGENLNFPQQKRDTFSMVRERQTPHGKLFYNFTENTIKHTHTHSDML